MKKILLIIIIVGLLGGGFYLYKHPDVLKNAWPGNGSQATTETVDPMGGAKSEDIAAISKYEYTETFTHTGYGFSFKYPKSFKVTSELQEEGEVILVVDTKTNIGIQILVTVYDGTETTLTESMIHENIPDIKISEPQELLLGGGEAGKGLAFLSDNEAFGGKSREVWFIFRGNLYQISTYAVFDEFLKGLFATWHFK